MKDNLLDHLTFGYAPTFKAGVRLQIVACGALLMAFAGVGAMILTTAIGWRIVTQAMTLAMVVIKL